MFHNDQVEMNKLKPDHDLRARGRHLPAFKRLIWYIAGLNDL